MSDISLYLDQDNELKFNVSIEGSKPGTPKYRLVFEGKECNYAFVGHQSAPGEIMFVVPAMKNTLKEGRYRGELEVMVDDRYFVPLQFDADFEASLRVVAESVAKSAPKRAAVTASIITSSTASNTQPKSVMPLQNEQRKVQQYSQTRKVTTKESLGEIDGRQITAEDLRNLIKMSRL